MELGACLVTRGSDLVLQLGSRPKEDQGTVLLDFYGGFIMQS